MILEVVKSLAAENDLIDIWVYSFDNWGIVQADKYLDYLNEGFEFIASNPLVGTSCDEIRVTYFSYPIKRHVAFYKIESKKLKVIRVLGADMNHVAHFQ